MKILLVHGVGHCEADPHYYRKWEEAISRQLGVAGAGKPPEYGRLMFDEVFNRRKINTVTYLEALARLAAAGAWHAIADPVDQLLHPSRDLGDAVRWRAGMVAQLCADEKLRTILRNALYQELADFEPDLIAAHSLGSLITYDFLRKDKRADSLKPATYLTFGSQINNAFARGALFPGPIKLPNVKFWYHLFNRQDPVLTAPIALANPKFLQVAAHSGAGHDPLGTPDNPGYLNHPETASKVWSALATPDGARTFRKTLRENRRFARKPPERRALLVGINAYPDAASRLEGCVNDTYLMSSLLQERGFEPGNIRVLLDARATARGIRERLEWLFEEAGDGAERVLFYSGHGAQMPGYSPAEQIDHVDECLVPWDFAWSKETAITDDDLFSLYSNLPFNARFIAVFDCCHAGGIHRDGGPRVRGIAPPDDIRHRLLRWDAGQQMWRERKLPSLNKDFGGGKQERARFMGKNGATFRIGRGMRARQLKQSTYRRLPRDERGPYLPVVIEACQESSLSYEYRDGATSYGAFTYSLTKSLRSKPDSTFLSAVNAAASTLKSMGYAQVPQILGPSAVVKRKINAGTGNRSRSKRN